MFVNEIGRLRRTFRQFSTAAVVGRSVHWPRVGLGSAEMSQLQWGARQAVGRARAIPGQLLVVGVRCTTSLPSRRSSGQATNGDLRT